jgi:nitrite reductase/ring-hydroxylating ferredoxin subunit
MTDGIDLVLVRRAGKVHVFEGRCPHRGALLADGRVEGANLICGVHGRDYRLDTGVSAYNPAERISKFTSHIEDGRCFPRLDHEHVDTAVTIGPAAARPLTLDIPVSVSDKSFGAISTEAKTSSSGRAPRPARAATCPAPRWWAGSARCAGWRRERPRCPGPVRRLDHTARREGPGRQGAGAVRRDPGRGQDVGPAIRRDRRGVDRRVLPVDAAQPPRP